MFKKGQIRNRKKSCQVIDYSGLIRRRGITPTDIDGLIDYNGKSFIYIEGKTIGAELKKGQKIAIQNLVDSHDKAGNKSTAIVFRHNTPLSKDIFAASCLVETVYFGGAWHEQEKPITVLQFIEKWENRVL